MRNSTDGFSNLTFYSGFYLKSDSSYAIFAPIYAGFRLNDVTFYLYVFYFAILLTINKTSHALFFYMTVSFIVDCP